MSGSVLLALLPVIILIGLGHLLRRHAFLGEGFWPGAERLCYFILLPSLFLQGLAAARLEALPVTQLAGTLVLSTLAVAVSLVAMRPLLPIGGAAFTSVVQGSIRFNNYIAITLAAGLFGAEGVALAAICNAAIVPTVNVLCILVFGRFGTAQLSTAGSARQIATNPLILACAGGILFQATGITIPTGLDSALRALGSASLPLGLLCVGAALDFGTASSWIGPVAGSSVMKFLAMPLATAVAAFAFQLEGTPLVVALLFQTMPTASSAYILARQLGGDAPLMAGIIAVQTLLAALAVPLVLAALVAVRSAS